MNSKMNKTLEIGYFPHSIWRLEADSNKRVAVIRSDQLSVGLFSPCQAAEGWGSEPTGDWGTEESWESVDGNQGRSLSGPWIKSVKPHMWIHLWFWILSHGRNLHLFLTTQVLVRLSWTRRSGKREGKSWRPNGRSAKLLKVLLNLALASWTDVRRTEIWGWRRRWCMQQSKQPYKRESQHSSSAFQKTKDQEQESQGRSLPCWSRPAVLTEGWKCPVQRFKMLHRSNNCSRSL